MHLRTSLSLYSLVFGALLTILSTGGASAEQVTLVKAPLPATSTNAASTNSVTAPLPPLPLIKAPTPQTNDAHGFVLNIDDSDSDAHDKHSSDHHDSSFMDDLSELIVPLCGILASFGTPVIIVFCVFYFRYRRRQENLMLAREYLNKGMPVPPQLLEGGSGRDYVEPLPQGQAAYDERKGVKLIFIGLGISIAFHFFNSHATYWAWGLIPMVIGCGYLLSGYMGRQREKSLPKSNLPPGPTAQ